MRYDYHQGTYEVQNKDKYLGTKNPRYLSSYEYRVFKFFDQNPNVIKWGAETVVVKYYNPVKQRKARYIADLYVEYVDKNGEHHKELIEIKPAAQVKKPVKRGKKRQDVFESEQRTYAVNQAKWNAAKEYARQRGWKFRILTENEIF